MFMHRFSKFEVLNWLELSRKQIGTSKSFLEYIFWLLLITAIVIWVNLSLNRFLQVGGSFFMEMNKGWSKKFIIWVILKHGNGSRKKFYLTPIIPGGLLQMHNNALFYWLRLHLNSFTSSLHIFLTALKRPGFRLPGSWLQLTKTGFYKRQRAKNDF